MEIIVKVDNKGNKSEARVPVPCSVENAREIVKANPDRITLLMAATASKFRKSPHIHTMSKKIDALLNESGLNRFIDANSTLFDSASWICGKGDWRERAMLAEVALVDDDGNVVARHEDLTFPLVMK